MRILITNDDGINAPGLVTLAAIAETLAGPDGEVWTVAPAFEQSGVAHCISYVHPTMIAQMGERRFAAEGTPADCVMAGLYDVMKDCPPDLILSGVNKGNNAGQNAMYSGTIGAAMEGALQNCKAIALSQYFGPANAKLDDPFEATAQHGAAVVQKLLDKAHWSDTGYRVFYNLNFPPCPGADVKGVLATPQGTRGVPNMGHTPHQAPNGRKFLWVTGVAQNTPAPEGSDVQANLDGYISVTPMRADLTAHDLLDDTANALT